MSSIFSILLLPRNNERKDEQPTWRESYAHFRLERSVCGQNYEIFLQPVLLETTENVLPPRESEVQAALSEMFRGLNKLLRSVLN